MFSRKLAPVPSGYVLISPQLRVSQKSAVRWDLQTVYTSDEFWITIIQATSTFQHNPGYDPDAYHEA